jgi:hypothetical protein
VSPEAAALAARLAAAVPPCPRCGRAQSPADYCAADDDGTCIRYVSRPLTPAEVGRLADR